MIFIRRWTGLNPVERRLLIEAWPLLWGIKAALALLPFRTVYRKVTRYATSSRGFQADSELAERRVRRVVLIVARYTPWRLTCLERAMAGLLLANRLGCTVEFCIGVERGSKKDLRAHAWLKGKSGVILGELDDLGSYEPLPLKKTS